MKLLVFLTLACVAITSCTALFMNEEKNKEEVVVAERDFEAILRMLKHVLCSADIDTLFGDKQVMNVLREVERREKRQFDFKGIIKMIHTMLCSME